MNDILRHLLGSTGFALVVALIVSRCRNHRAVVRYHLWLLAALKFAVPTSLFVTVGQWVYHAWSPQNLFSAMSWYGPDKHPFLSSTPVSAPSGVFGQALWLVWMFGSGLHLGAWLLRLRQTQSTTDVSASVSQMVFQLQRRMSLRRLVKVRSAAPEGELALSGIWFFCAFHPTRAG